MRVYNAAAPQEQQQAAETMLLIKAPTTQGLILLGCKLNFSTFAVLITTFDSESFNFWFLGFSASEHKS